MSSFGDRLRSERETRRLSQTEFGELGGVRKGAQANYEAGERMPDAAYLLALLPHGIDIWFVLTGERFPLAEDSVTGPAARLLTIFNGLSVDAQGALLGIAEALAAPKP